MEEEVRAIRENHDEQMTDMTEVLKAANDREKELMQEIREESEKINALQREHNELIENLQNKLNNTLNF